MQDRKLRSGYFAAVSFVDFNIGHVLDALGRFGLAGNTNVVLWGDNGFHLGEKGVFAKRSIWEPSVDVPLVVRSPSLPGARGVVQEIVELVDIFPTVVNLAGYVPPFSMQLEGVSLAPLMFDLQLGVQGKRQRKQVCYAAKRIRCARCMIRRCILFLIQHPSGRL